MINIVGQPPHAQYDVQAIDVTKPIVTAEATATSVKLTLTNLKIVALDDFITGKITFGGMWAHEAGEGKMTVFLGGEFNRGIGAVDDKYSVTFTGDVAGNLLTIGPLTGPPPNRFPFPDDPTDPQSKSISLEDGIDPVTGVLTFALDRVISTLTFRDSADTLAAIPEPSSFLLLGTGLLASLGYAWRRRKLNS